MTMISVKTNSRSELVNITRQIEEQIPAEMQTGICHAFCLHTTAALTINENADPDVRNDIDTFLNQLVPWQNGLFRHMEGNSAAHIKASLLGFSETIPVENGRLLLGTWQDIYFCEFDGPRSRKVKVNFIPEFS